MLSLILSIAYILCIYCVGRAALKFLGKGADAAVAFALGCGILSTALFWASLAGVRPTRVCVLIGTLLLSGIFFWAARISRQEVFIEEKKSGRIFLLPVLIGLAVVTYTSVVVPMDEWDAMAIWGLKAKVVYQEPVRAASYFHDPAKSYSHVDYPLGLPFLTAGLYGILGGYENTWGKAVLPCIYLAFVFLPLGFLTEKLGRPAAGALTAAAAVTPAVIRWAGAGTADCVLMMYVTGTLIFLARWIEGGPRSDMALAILFSAFGVFTKNEGLPIVLALGISVGLAAPPGRRRGAVIYAAGVLVLSLPWLLFLQTLPQTKENYWARAAVGQIIPHLDRLGVILPAWAAEAVQFKNWSGTWLILAASAAVGARAFMEGSTRFLWFALLQIFAVYVLAYVVTPYDVNHLMSVSLTRLSLHLLPAAILLTGAHLGAFLKH